MRWDGLSDHAAGPGRGPGPALPLFEAGPVSRAFDAPAFRGMTFHEVRARTIINRVPPASRMAFRWTINPYRGCSHACAYCFARYSHTYLGLDAGADFNTQVVVKVNAAELAARELAAPRWRGEHIAMGTNVDCYQRAEGRYRLMPGIIAALAGAANPFSILTKGTLILRDLDLLAVAAEVTDVGLNMSVGCTDPQLWRSVEPGTPSPERRLAACAAINARGLRCGVLMGPVLPFLTDSPGQLAATVRQIAAAGPAHVSPIVLHLRPGAREWYLRWLGEHHPALMPRYRELYGTGAYAPRAYQRHIAEQVRQLASQHGIGRASPARARRLPPRGSASDRGAASHDVQLSLL
jgi:DNA repair photolyase